MEFEQKSNEDNTSPDDKEKKKKRKRRPARVPLSIDQESTKQENPEQKSDSKPRSAKRRAKSRPAADKEKPAAKDKKTPDTISETAPSEEDLTDESDARQKPERIVSDEVQPEEEVNPSLTEQDSEPAPEAIPESEDEQAVTDAPLQPKREAILPVREKEEHEEELFVSDRLLKSQPQEHAEAEGEPSALQVESEPDNEKETEANESQKVNLRQRATRSRAGKKPKRAGASSSATTPIGVSNATGGGALPGPAVVPVAAANTAPRPSNEQELYYVERNGVRRGVISGLLLGGMIEHFRHRRREKKLKANLAKAEKTAKQAEENQTFTQQEAARNEHEGERRKTALERQIERLRNEIGSPPKAAEQVSEKRQEQQSTAHRPEAPYAMPLQHERSTAATTASQERVSPAMELKQRSQPERSDLKPDIRKAQQAVEEAIEEQLKAPKGHHIETSAWHAIEVDNKTGRAVENPIIAYGEEFKNEQHQELLRQQAADAENEKQKKQHGELSNYELFQQAATPKLPEHASPDSNTKYAKTSPLAQKAKDLQSTVSNTHPIDIALWATLFVVIIAIIIAL